MTSPTVRRLPGRTGTVPVAGFLAFTLFVVLLLGYSPTLNPLDMLLGDIGAVQMPKIVGLTQTKSLVELEKKHLHGKVTFGFSSTYGRGIVMEQHPAAGDPLDRGGTARVVVSRGAGQVLLPDLSGVAEKDAQHRLEQSNLTVKIDRVNDESAEVGKVFSQEPAAGTVVIGGSKVELRVSLGPATRTVPDVAGLPVEGAAFVLGKAGFTIGNITRSDNPLVVRDAVIGTDPPAKASASRDAPISLIVSDGRPPVAVPGVTGIAKDAASLQLGKLGFVIGEVTQTGPVGDPLDGTVMAQIPDPGTMLRPGDVVSITVRRASKPPPPTAAPTTAPAATTPPATSPPATSPPATTPPVTTAPKPPTTKAPGT